MSDEPTREKFYEVDVWLCHRSGEPSMARSIHLGRRALAICIGLNTSQEHHPLFMRVTDSGGRNEGRGNG